MKLHLFLKFVFNILVSLISTGSNPNTDAKNPFRAFSSAMISLNAKSIFGFIKKFSITLLIHLQNIVSILSFHKNYTPFKYLAQLFSENFAYAKEGHRLPAMPLFFSFPSLPLGWLSVYEICFG